MPLYFIGGSEGLAKETPGANVWDLSGRFRTYSDNRWVTYANSYNSKSSDHSAGMGTLATPNLNVDIGGQFIREGQVVTKLIANSRASDASITDVEYAVVFREAGAVASLEVYTGSVLSIGTGLEGTNATMTLVTPWTAPADGWIYPAIRPTGTMDGSAYVYANLYAL